MSENINLTIKAEKIPKHKLILMEQIASGQKGNEKFYLHLSGGSLIAETPKGRYSISMIEIMEQVIEKAQEDD